MEDCKEGQSGAKWDAIGQIVLTEGCKVGQNQTKGKLLHCRHTAHAEAGILTRIIRLVVTVLFPWNPFQKNEPSKNI